MSLKMNKSLMAVFALTSIMASSAATAATAEQVVVQDTKEVKTQTVNHDRWTAIKNAEKSAFDCPRYPFC